MPKAIVTGHTRGLGAAVAEALLARGWAVLGLARTAHPDLGARYPGTFSQVGIDLADSEALVAWLAMLAVGWFIVVESRRPAPPNPPAHPPAHPS